MPDDDPNTFADESKLQEATPSEEQRQAYEERDTQDKSTFKRVLDTGRKVLAGENRAGKIIGFALDAVTFFAPHGSKIDMLRQKGKQALNLNNNTNDMKDAIKRAFTLDGGGLIRVRNEQGEIDIASIGASLLRTGLIILVLYLAEIAGVLDQLMVVFD